MADEYIMRSIAIAKLTALEVTDPFATIADAKRVLADMDAANVAPVVHGHFVHDGPRFSGGVDWWHCSSCGRLASGVETRFCYCPFCGAKMDGGDDGETD